METNLPALYLGVLLILLAAVGWFVFRQILRTRRIETALSRLQAKLKQEKGTAQEYFELGSIYLNKKLTTQAIPLLQKALKTAETDPTAITAPIYNALGYAYFVQDQYDLAIRNYKEALSQDPAYVTAANNLGHAYERKSLVTQALEAYEQALGADPNNAVAKRRANSLKKRIPA
ncbi:tetratricopeptide repeat protein [Thermosynechococcaceae cyanobacterium BACA0444]|uniref:Tetratricopeptide repeat protein n=1 Tax=Pseudocalidococcus azoricus BACA0444 TaxID=2918990 RepID=A0AAE4FVX1_9CYAN|nr:tetratricopeptide repeat protein [Pseudocalidococcus azoricus]MDS3861910.1 tetratricopeptide repeat protein [Pseudocalidococcus azoricus BACA0444]